MQTSRFNLGSLLTIVLSIGLLIAVLFPAMNVSRPDIGSMVSVGTRGKDIYVAIISANTEREPLGLPSVWPKSNPPTNKVDDISQMNFTNSTDYFTALYDGEHVGTAEHNPYVRGFDYRKLAGAGVPCHQGWRRLKPENNMWTIAKNVRETMEEIVPVLVTRNLAAESLVADLPTMSDRQLCFDAEWKTPFGNKGFVIVRKSGGIFNYKAKYATFRVLYGNQTFQTTLSGSQDPGLCYLTPNKEVIPSEAAYQACAKTCKENYKWDGLAWLKEVLRESLPALFCFLVLGLFSGGFIFVRVVFDRELKEPLSILGPVYWILLWLSVTSYLYCPVMRISMGYAVKGEQVLFVLALAPLFQIAGCLLLALWRRRTNHVETYRMAFGLMVLAPVLAFQCLLILAAVEIFSLKHILFFGLASGALICFRISDKTKLPLPFSVMGSLYWVLLWLAVTAYMLCPLIFFTRVSHLSLVPTLAFACLLHILSSLYLVACNRGNGKPNNFKTILLAIFIAPVVACQSLIFIIVLGFVFDYFRGFLGINYYP